MIKTNVNLSNSVWKFYPMHGKKYLTSLYSSQRNKNILKILIRHPNELDGCWNIYIAASNKSNEVKVRGWAMVLEGLSILCDIGINLFSKWTEFDSEIEISKNWIESRGGEIFKNWKWKLCTHTFFLYRNSASPSFVITFYLFLTVDATNRAQLMGGHILVEVGSLNIWWLYYEPP